MKETTASRGLAAVPFLMMPMAVGAVWLTLAPHAVTPRAIVVLGGVAVAWYLLGGVLTLRRLGAELALAGQVRRTRRQLRQRTDCAYLVAPDGTVRGQTPLAERIADLSGSPASVLLARSVADPETRGTRLGRRALLEGAARFDLGDGRRIEAERIPGTDLQLWRIAAAEPAADAVPAPVAAPPATDYGFEQLPVALLELEPDGAVRTANAAARALLGPDAAGRHLGDLVEAPGRPMADWLAEVREGRDSGRGEVLPTRGDGVERDVQLTLARAPDGTRIIGVLSDASALKTLEAQFVQSQKMQAIGQLAGGIAHDFNNLLTAITGHCDLLMLRRDKTDPDYDDLHQISQNANRAAALVRQLLAFSRKQTLKPQILDLREVLPDLTHLLNRLVGEKIVLTVSNDPSLRPIRADRRQLEQVLMNLVVNARDAMPQGGEIAVQTENVRLGAGRKMEHANLPRGDYVRVTVTDQGCGIAPDLLAKIFDPFFTTKRTGEGTGLGLSTAYGIVKQTGGYIFCDSVVGEGTTFTLYFPAQAASLLRDRKPEPAPQLVPPPVEAPEDRPRRILLVEDESPVRAFASRALKLRGFEVLEADSGERALDILGDDRVDIDMFVTDVVMPGMDGPTWVRAALRDRPGTPVIFMSGYTEVTLSDATSPIAHALFLPKPFSLSELVASVENHLAGRPGPAQPASAAIPAA